MASVFKRGEDKGDRLARWYISYSDETSRRRTVKGCPDKAATEAMARRLESEAELRRRGVIDPKADGYGRHEARPLADHLADWKADQLARGVTPKQARQNHTRAARVVELAGARRLSDLTPSGVQAALGAIRAEGAALRTVHHITRAIKGFSRWLWKDGRTRDDALAHIAPPKNPDSDRRRTRRALTPEEAAALIRAAESGPVVFKLSGPDRAALYRTALGTGFRAAELTSLTPESFRLDDAPPAVVVAAAYSKRRREDVQPIRPDLAEALRPWLATKAPGAPLWTVPSYHTAEMIRRDLAAAGVAYETEPGVGVADFHSLRHTYVSNLARSRAPVKVVQALARHSTPTLTFGTYAHIGIIDQTAALDALPPSEVAPDPASEAVRATGTDPVNRPGRAAPAQRAGDGTGRIESDAGDSESMGTGSDVILSMGRKSPAMSGDVAFLAGSDATCRSGGGGIRTPGTLAGSAVFKTAPIDHSGTPPTDLAFAITTDRSATDVEVGIHRVWIAASPMPDHQAIGGPKRILTEGTGSRKGPTPGGVSATGRPAQADRRNTTVVGISGMPGR